jgi:hypothetical protein
MKTSSSVPVRFSSSSDPDTSTLPRARIATSVQRRSTISSTWLVRNTVISRFESEVSRSRIVRAATGSIPSNGSSRKSTRGP